jgi:hypothetical protein
MRLFETDSLLGNGGLVGWALLLIVFGWFLFMRK